MEIIAIAVSALALTINVTTLIALVYKWKRLV